MKPNKSFYKKLLTITFPNSFINPNFISCIFILNKPDILDFSKHEDTQNKMFTEMKENGLTWYPNG